MTEDRVEKLLQSTYDDKTESREESRKGIAVEV